jgi:hypothetical protein
MVRSNSGCWCVTTGAASSQAFCKKGAQVTGDFLECESARSESELGSTFSAEPPQGPRSNYRFRPVWLFRTNRAESATGSASAATSLGFDRYSVCNGQNSPLFRPLTLTIAAPKTYQQPARRTRCLLRQRSMRVTKSEGTSCQRVPQRWYGYIPFGRDSNNRTRRYCTCSGFLRGAV